MERPKAAVVGLFESVASGIRLPNRSESKKEQPMQISARNNLEGTVKRVEHGAVNSEITIELPGGLEIVSIITKQSAERLQIATGKAVHAVVKASDVMIATD
jgi:molybdopterin-binding protein